MEGIMTEKPKLSEEISRMAEEYEPLMPVEKKLIAISLIVGTALIGILLFVSYTFFPAGH
jgi:hypothetical protein